MPRPQPALTRNAVYSLYRTYLREIRKLPHVYLQQFSQVKASLDVRAVLDTQQHISLQRRKFKRVSKEVQRLQDATSGTANRRTRRAFAHVLDLAYGRKGPLRWDIMKPLLTDPQAPLPPRIIPAVESSRPPVYSPELTALLTSRFSRTTKALKANELVFPPKLPPRADPNSEMAKMLGPLSKRREVNIRWRYFTQEWKKVLPPLEVTVVEKQRPNNEIISESRSKDAAVRSGIRPVGLQGLGVVDELVRLAGPPRIPQGLTRKEIKATGAEALRDPSTIDSQTQPDADKPRSRWLRRRYQELLGRLPTLTYTRIMSERNELLPRSKHEVRLEASALPHTEQIRSNRMSNADPAHMEWAQLTVTRAKDEQKPKR